MNLVEKYAARLRVAESIYSRTNENAKMDSRRQLMIARCLENTNKFLKEGLGEGATQSADMGAWKKFCINLVNVALPTLIAPELVMVQAMSSMTGYKH